MTAKPTKRRKFTNEKKKHQIWNHCIARWAEQYGEEYGPFMGLRYIKEKLWTNHDFWDQLECHGFFGYTPEEVAELWPRMYRAGLGVFWREFDTVSFSCNIVSRRSNCLE